MFRHLIESLDRCALRSACGAIPDQSSSPHHAAEAHVRVEDPHYFSLPLDAPPRLTFRGRTEFTFDSAVMTPWPENNVVFGRLHRAGKDWRTKPGVLLLHGWNGECGYHWHFPYLAWRLNRAGLNVAMIELPYHARRRPSEPGATSNFLSHDLLSIAEAVRQAVVDARLCMAWLLEQGLPAVGVWGVSLGGWLSGLVICHEPRARCAVLLTPVVRMDRALRELPFCAPIRRHLAGVELHLDSLNLASHRLCDGAERVLIVKSEYDLFAPAETIEELWRAWNRPEIWRYPHGHISILMSLPIMEKVVRWMAQKLGPGVLGPGAEVSPEPDWKLKAQRP